MNRLDRYVMREFTVPFLFALLLYSALAVMSANIPRLQWVVGTPLGTLAYWLLLQVPAALVQTLPVAMLLGVLVSFGSLRASNELLALQAGGVALRRLALMMLAVGAAVAMGSLAMNQWVLPSTNTKVGSLWWQLSSGGSGLFRLVNQGLPIGPYTLSFSRLGEHDEMMDVRLESWQGDKLGVIHAKRAKFVPQGLNLYNYRFVRLDVAALDQAAQNDAETLLRQLVGLYNRAPDASQPLTIKLSKTPEELITDYSNGGFEDSRSLSKIYQDVQNKSLSHDERRKAEVLWQRKLSEPFANLSLLAVALPLALFFARSRSVAFGMSLVVTIIWYLLLSIGQLMAQSGMVQPWLGMWAGHVVLIIIGLLLLGRAVTQR